jgi:glycosyltransferase involved in cell wall biosynthesis
MHVHRVGGIGGSERHLLTLLPALAERGVDVSFLGLDDTSRAPDPFYEALTVPYVRLPAPRDLDVRLALAVRRAIRRADLVHTHLVHADVYGALGSRRLVSTKHNDDPFRAGAFRYVERALARRAAKIIAITSALARFQIERVGLPAEKVEVVHYGSTTACAVGHEPSRPFPRGAAVLAVCFELQKGVDGRSARWESPARPARSAGGGSQRPELGGSPAIASISSAGRRVAAWRAVPMSRAPVR